MENFNTKDIIAVLVKNKKAIIVVTIIAAVASAIISFILKPKYKSYAVVYPVNLSPSSEESNTEQLLQYFYSEEVKNEVARKYNLYAHYEVDTNANGYQALFDLYYKSNINISPTLYESIDITVKDESPEMAQKVAQGLIDATNKLIQNLKRERLNEYIINSLKGISYEMKGLDSLNKNINEIRSSYNIIDVGAQAKYLSKKMMSGKPLTESENKLFNGIRSNNTDLEKLWNAANGLQGTMNYFRDQKDKYIFDYNSEISFTNVVSKPTLPDKKFFPVRWLIVSVSSLSVFALACLYFILTNKALRKVD